MSKIRKCFVSNSSSSSFTCDVCGNTVSGFDMYKCKNGHIFCGHEMLDTEEDVEGYSNVSISCCPICQLKEVTTGDMLKYVLKLSGLTYKQAVKQIQDKFGTYQEFQVFLTQK